MTELKDDVYLTGAFKRVQYRPFGLDPIISVKEKEAKHGDHEIASISLTAIANAALPCDFPSTFRNRFLEDGLVDTTSTPWPRLVRGCIVHDLLSHWFVKLLADEFGCLDNNQLQGRE